MWLKLLCFDFFICIYYVVEAHPSVTPSDNFLKDTRRSSNSSYRKWNFNDGWYYWFHGTSTPQPKSLDIDRGLHVTVRNDSGIFNWFKPFVNSLNIPFVKNLLRSEDKPASIDLHNKEQAGLVIANKIKTLTSEVEKLTLDVQDLAAKISLKDLNQENDNYERSYMRNFGFRKRNK